MEKVTLAKVVGFVLAVLFALVMGLSTEALLAGDYMQPNSSMNEQARDTLRIVGFAGGLTALLAWWVQGFASQRGFVVRFLFGLFVFVVAFCSFGGLLTVISNLVTHPNNYDWSLSGIYWTSQASLASFVLFMLLRPVYGGVMLAAALYLALFGPRSTAAAA
jgi:hypothetical protein